MNLPANCCPGIYKEWFPLTSWISQISTTVVMPTASDEHIPTTLAVQVLDAIHNTCVQTARLKV